jgi:hypothetical protein
VKLGIWNLKRSPYANLRGKRPVGNLLDQWPPDKYSGDKQEKLPMRRLGALNGVNGRYLFPSRQLKIAD